MGWVGNAEAISGVGHLYPYIVQTKGLSILVRAGGILGVVSNHVLSLDYYLVLLRIMYLERIRFWIFRQHSTRKTIVVHCDCPEMFDRVEGRSDASLNSGNTELKL
jgi:hypothetical protein